MKLTVVARNLPAATDTAGLDPEMGPAGCYVHGLELEVASVIQAVSTDLAPAVEVRLYPGIFPRVPLEAEQLLPMLSILLEGLDGHIQQFYLGHSLSNLQVLGLHILGRGVRVVVVRKDLEPDRLLLLVEVRPCFLEDLQDLLLMTGKADVHEGAYCRDEQCIHFLGARAVIHIELVEPSLDLQISFKGLDGLGKSEHASQEHHPLVWIVAEMFEPPANGCLRVQDMLRLLEGRQVIDDGLLARGSEPWHLGPERPLLDALVCQLGPEQESEDLLLLLG